MHVLMMACLIVCTAWMARAETLENDTALTMETGHVVSADGTHIGYTRYGSGSPLIVCHGTHSVASDWDSFGQAMGKGASVYIYDRRGRGTSSDVDRPYTHDSEIDDLAAMVKLIGNDAAILGHSLGGGVALAYSLRDGFRGRLILYEPGHSVVQKVSRGLVPKLQALIEGGQFEAATDFGMREIGGLPSEEIAKLKLTPLWQSMVELNKLFPRELLFLDQLDWTKEQLSQLQCRVWMLMGSLSLPPEGEVSRVAALVDRVPGMTLYPLIGEGHTAYMSNPSLLARVVAQCMEPQ